MHCLYCFFEAPLLSFGAPAVDETRPAGAFPTRSMLTGLVANALGWDHAHFERLQALQEGLRVGARADRPGEVLRDFHTVDLSQGFMQQGWTTRGRVERRGGGSAKTGTHIRYRYYRADAVWLVVLSWAGTGGPVSLSDIENALAHPARPIFFGRKSCPPSRPLRPVRVEAAGLAEVLATIPLHPRHVDHRPWTAWCPADDPSLAGRRMWPVRAATLRDWANQVHTGTEELVRFGVEPPTRAGGEA